MKGYEVVACVRDGHVMDYVNFTIWHREEVRPLKSPGYRRYLFPTSPEGMIEVSGGQWGVYREV